MDYPKARKGDIVENYHGISVADPYRWLEDPDSEETKAWVAEQNKITTNFIKNIPDRARIRDRIKELWNYKKRSAPYREGSKYFFMANDGLQNQFVLYVQTTAESKLTVLLDPNTWSEDGTVALSTYSPSKDGSYVGYAVSEKGSDWQKIKILKIGNGPDCPEVLEWCKFTNISWNKESTGFYYGRYPKPEGNTLKAENHSNQIYFHKLGTNQEEDVLVYADPEDKGRHFSLGVTEDGGYLVLESMKGTGSTNTVHVKKIGEQDFTSVFEKEDAQYSFINNIRSKFYFQTDKDAPKRKIIVFDILTKEQKEVLSENDYPLSSSRIIDDKIVTVYMKDAHDILKIFDLEGNLIKDIVLPYVGTIGGISGKRKHKDFFISLASFLSPSTVFQCDFSELKVFHKTEVPFETDNYETTQTFVTSKDGTKVPMFITHKKGTTMDGTCPTLLHGYGGFNISVQPYYSSSVASLLDMGGIYVETNLRGGSEYGSDWHKSGMRDKKQNVFDDFIACAEFLIEKKYTSPQKLAIIGGSNGGLLVSACMTQRPDLYGAVICMVPVTDMLRFHKFTVGKYWIEEYGNAERSKEEFNFLYKYSPLHNVKEVEYPPILIWTADHDDRVVSAHAKKLAATLQEKGKGGPLLLHIETAAGHGSGKPTEKVIEEKADIYAFLWKVLEMTE